MKRHLDKKKKCKCKNENFNMSDNEVYEKSLEKKELDNLEVCNVVPLIIETIETRKNYCHKCNISFSKTYNYQRHIKTNKCLSMPDVIIKSEEPILLNTDNTKYQQNIINNNTVNQYINVNINLNNNLKGFDEKWDTSRIDKYQMSGLLLSNNKFSNTLQKLLENEANLNVFVNKDVGVVYKSENDAYEVISKKELMRQTIEKLYEHLNDFYNELVNGEYNDIAKDTDFFNKHIKNARHNYNRYYYKTEDFKNKADEALLYFYNQVKSDAEKKYMEKMEEKTNLHKFII